MKRAFELVSPERDMIVEVDWGICFICQQDTKGEICKPYKRQGKKYSYHIILTH